MHRPAAFASAITAAYPWETTKEVQNGEINGSRKMPSEYVDSLNLYLRNNVKKTFKQ